MNSGTRTLAILLALSFGVNMFIGGMWLGDRLSGKDAHLAVGMPVPPTAPPPHRLALGAAFRELPPELRAEFRSNMGLDAGRIGELMNRERRARAQTLDALTAQPFNGDALAKGLQAMRAAETERRALAHNALVGVAGKLTPEQRAAMRRGLGQSLSGRHRHILREGSRNGDLRQRVPQTVP